MDTHERRRTSGIDSYPPGRTDAESRRLVEQHQIYSPITRQLLTSAGVGRGMKVLDVGSGAGDIAMLCADLVGPEGSVTGVDLNGDILAFARRRVAAAGWTNVQFVQADLADLDLSETYDAVVGRWILMYVPAPDRLLRRLARNVRPGGVIVFQESGDLAGHAYTYPPLPVHEQLRGWLIVPPGVKSTAVPDMGRRLYTTFLAAGLAAPQLRQATPVGGGPDWPGYRLLAESARSLLPFLERVGAARASDVDPDTLEQRLRDEVLAANAVQLLPTVIGAWTTT